MIQLQPLDFIQGGYRVNVAGSVCRRLCATKILLVSARRQREDGSLRTLPAIARWEDMHFSTTALDLAKAHKGSTPGGASDILFRSQRYTVASRLKRQVGTEQTLVTTEAQSRAVGHVDVSCSVYASRTISLLTKLLQTNSSLPLAQRSLNPRPRTWRAQSLRASQAWLCSRPAHVEQAMHRTTKWHEPSSQSPHERRSRSHMQSQTWKDFSFDPR